MKALAHSLFAFVFCVAVFELAMPANTDKVLVLLSGTVALMLAWIPDIDTHVPQRLVRHRSGMSHSIFTVVICTSLVYVLLSRYPPLDLVIVPALTSAIASHVLLDALTKSGCPLLWPLSRRCYSARLCKFDSTVANALIVLLSAFAIIAFVVCG